MDTDDNDAVTLTVDGRLNIEATSGHNFFSIAGNGTISVEGDVSSNDNFPTGNVALFADPVVGGTVGDKVAAGRPASRAKTTQGQPSQPR